MSLQKSTPIYMKNLVSIKQANVRQYQWLYENKCEHRHRYSIHFNCFLKDNNISERVGFLDIETSNLKANFGIVLCWCLLDADGVLYGDWMRRDDVLEGNEDKRVVSTCIDLIRNSYDRVVGHYSTYFDIPFLRTRALIHGLKFPEQGSILHTDTWKMAKRSLCLHSNRQDVIAESLFGKTCKTRISHPAWRKAMLGDEKAMKEVVNHCQKDVQDLKRNYNALLPFVRPVRSSI